MDPRSALKRTPLLGIEKDPLTLHGSCVQTTNHVREVRFQMGRRTSPTELQDIVRRLKELHASGRYTDKQCYDIQGEINYFTENKERMDYPLYRSVSLPIGSGVVVLRCAPRAEVGCRIEDAECGGGRSVPSACLERNGGTAER